MTPREPGLPRAASAFIPIKDRKPRTADQRAAGERGTWTGRWRVRIRNRDGEIEQVGILATKSAGKEAAANRVAELNAEAEPSAGPDVPLASHIRDWPQREDIHPLTLATNQERARRVLRHLDLESGSERSRMLASRGRDLITLQDLTVGDLERARRRMMDAGLWRKTIDDAFASLSRLLRTLAKDDATIVDIARGIRVPKRTQNYEPQSRRAFRAVPWEEMQAFVTKYVPESDAAIFWAPAATGCRLGELLALNINDYRPASQTVVLKAIINKEGVLEEGLKTTHGLDIGQDPTRETIYPKALLELFARRPAPIDGYLVRDATGTFFTPRDFLRYSWGDPYPPSKATYEGPMTRYERDGGRRFTTNDLRHTFATWLIEGANVPHWIVDTWMGHTDRRLEGFLGVERRRRNVLDQYYLEELGTWRPHACGFLNRIIRGESGAAIQAFRRGPD